MSDDEQPESDIRRRAAWLLGMLALVAALVVTVMVVFLDSGSGDGDDPDDIAGPTGTLPSSSQPSRSVQPSRSTPSGASTTSTSSTSQQTSSGSGTGSSDSGSPGSPGSLTCPDDAPSGKPCALDSDVGKALDAINDYRRDHDKSPVEGAVGPQAQQCAVRNGSGCSGGWAETQLSKPDGPLAVQKIKPFGKLLSDMKSIEIGWAYDPAAKQYYFAIIRK